jgi:23S rRNA G2069 N7-methylase RlmK/C1962 C5-methylase RlmI
MNGLTMALNCAEPATLDVFCKRLMTALAELKVRLQAQYEHRFPDEGSRIRKTIKGAEVAAWRARFPRLFLSDLAEEGSRGARSP